MIWKLNKQPQGIDADQDKCGEREKASQSCRVCATTFVVHPNSVAVDVDIIQDFSKHIYFLFVLYFLIIL